MSHQMSHHTKAGHLSPAEVQLEKFQKFGSRLGLERITEMLKRLGNPQEGMKIIHVAGTNGKGSVCRFLYEVLEEHGYRVGLYTSPYLERFEERVEFDRAYITEEEVEHYTKQAIEVADKMVEEGWDSPTEFEVTTAMAVLYFASKNPDFVILEVGLGGRGDSTNITNQPLISVITSIAYDHMDRLGDTLEEIAYDKAGIIKEGVPVVSMVSHDDAPEAVRVIAREAYEKHATLCDAANFKSRIIKSDKYGSKFNVRIRETEYNEIEISMCGEHQVENAVCALATIEILRKSGIIKVYRDALGRGMKKACQKGRFEVFTGDTDIVLDGAHNEAGMESLLNTCDSCYYQKKILVVLGILADKAVDEMLDKAMYLGEDFIATEPESPRKLDAETLAQKLRSRGKNCESVPVPEEAYEEAMKRASEYDAILFAGSLYLIGRIRSMHNREEL